MNPQFALPQSNRSKLIFLASLLFAVVLYPGFERTLEHWMPNTNISVYGNNAEQSDHECQWNWQSMWQ